MNFYTLSTPVPKNGRVAFKLILFMKCVFLLMTVFCLQVSATTSAQQINFSERNVSLKKVFNAIQKQTKYVIWYEDNLLQNTTNINVSLRNASLTETLDACLKDQPLTYTIVNNTIVVQRKAHTKDGVTTVPVKGKVTDAKGLGLPGVTIKLKGSTTTVVTDNNGNYQLSLSEPKGILTFSYIGYESKEVSIDGRTEINILLKEINSDLNEVVVVGFGVQKKANLTGAVDQITSKDLINRPVANVGDALQGLMANLNISTNYGGGAPGAAKSMNIRGFTGLNGELAGPLILVDGVETNINSVNANDIESISLLKDAASAAVYGSRAPNGVLLITTKQGQKNQAPRLSYSNNISFSQPLNVPVMSNSLTWAQTLNEAYLNAGLAQFVPDEAINRIQKYINNPTGTPTTVAIPGANQWANYDPQFANSNNDWFKLYLKRWSPSQEHNISIDGGSDKTTYFIGLGSTDKNGLYNFASDSYKRKNLRANITTDVNKYITFSLKTSFAQENDDAPFNGGANTGNNWFHQIARIWPIIALTDPNGGYDSYSYVAQIEQGGRNTSRTNESRISGDITIKPLPGWNITGHYNYDYNTTNGMISILPYLYSTPNNPQTQSATVSSVSKTNESTNYYNYNVFSNYEKHLGDHYFKAMVGVQTEKKTYSYLYGYNSDLYNLSQPSLALTSGIAPSTTDGGYSWSTNSTIGRINYNYKEKYLLEGNASYMGTSLFPQDTRYHLFASGSAGWVLSKEDFFKPLLSTISNVKLRGSYGGLGDISYFLDKGNYYPYQSYLNTSSSTNTSWIFDPASGGRLPNVSNPTNTVSPTLTWAKPSMLDLGIDIDFLTDFSATFDWYRKNITAQFGQIGTFPAQLGVTPALVNNSASVTKGFDLTVSWKHQYGDVNVTARANIGHYSGKVTQYDQNVTQSINDKYKGEPIGAIWGFETVGKFQSQQQIKNSPSQAAINGATWNPGDIQYADLNGDGKIDYGNNTLANPGDRKIIGNTTPDFLYGFNTGASWKGFDLSIFIQGQGHADYMPGNNYFWGVTSTYQSTVTPKLSDRWTPSNPNGYFPRLDINNGGRNQITQSGYLLNTAYMRLKNAQIGYTFPNKLTEKIHVYGLRLYCSIENVLTISGALKHQYVDPELLQSDEKIYPLQRSYSFGLKMNIQ
ncbi:hypothetical protein DBR11_21650 [Pedobacter sp. HMWF019]|uniref:TonB-dependent receptor n=1 Tax=Pedobacter sp. HMWF019 TaxID=2056856 RepID=UPI000D345122|nr:TonB-dependent receptor [Pedobacter sp. HMWF019]PTS95205.1 hypothetical protein DBR11_21650 [Pedobacter sp. HMWF019]